MAISCGSYRRISLVTGRSLPHPHNYRLDRMNQQSRNYLDVGAELSRPCTGRRSVLAWHSWNCWLIHSYLKFLSSVAIVSVKNAKFVIKATTGPASAVLGVK